MYFREAIADYLKDWCEENGYDLYSSGLKIYTTLDTRMQKYAEQAAMKQMKQVQQNFNNHWGIYRNQSKNWMRMAPWRDENGNEIPGFIDQIAERQPFYKALQAKYANDPDSIRYYYKEWVHPVKALRLRQGHHHQRDDVGRLHQVHGVVHALRHGCHGATDRRREGLGR